MYACTFLLSRTHSVSLSFSPFHLPGRRSLVIHWLTDLPTNTQLSAKGSTQLQPAWSGQNHGVVLMAAEATTTAAICGLISTPTAVATAVRISSIRRHAAWRSRWSWAVSIVFGNVTRCFMIHTHTKERTNGRRYIIQRHLGWWRSNHEIVIGMRVSRILTQTHKSIHAYIYVHTNGQTVRDERGKRIEEKAWRGVHR